MDNSEQIKNVSEGARGVAGGATLRVPWAQASTETFEALKNSIDEPKEQIERLKNFKRQLRRKLSGLRYL